MTIEIERTTALRRVELEALLREATGPDHRYLIRLVDDWERGSSRYDGDGEALLLAREGGQVVGTIGLIIDAYAAAPLSGRLRRLYLLQRLRGRGLGRLMVNRVVALATGRFEQLLVRANRPGPASFFEHLGFRPATAEPEATHVLVLPFAQVHRASRARGERC